MLFLLFSERNYFFKYETNLTRTVADACELCRAGAAVEYCLSRAANDLSYSLGVDAGLFSN
jgi:hypothetical protein